MPTIEQIRAARALLGWNQTELADQAGLSQTGIARIENGTNQPNTHTLNKIKQAFDKADIEFIDNSGVKKRTGEIKTFEGIDGFKAFLDDVYETAKTQGGIFCLHNAKPDNWHKWLGEEWFQMHAARMSELKDKISFKITAEEGNKNLISSSFAEYRWFPKHLFNDQSIYAYANKLAFVTFRANNITVHVLENDEFSKGFTALFDVAWETVAIKIKDE